MHLSEFFLFYNILHEFIYKLNYRFFGEQIGRHKMKNFTNLLLNADTANISNKITSIFEESIKISYFIVCKKYN